MVTVVFKESSNKLNAYRGHHSPEKSILKWRRHALKQRTLNNWRNDTFTAKQITTDTKKRSPYNPVTLPTLCYQCQIRR